MRRVCTLGGLMGLIFGHAFSRAIAAKVALDEGLLIPAAKERARAVIAELKA